MKVLLDTSVFVSAFAKDSHYPCSGRLLSKVAAAHDGYFCSMTLNEIVWVLRKLDCSWRFIAARLELPFSIRLRYLVPTRDVYRRSVELAEKHRLTYADAQIAAHFLCDGMDCLASFDEDFDRVKGLVRVETL